MHNKLFIPYVMGDKDFIQHVKLLVNMALITLRLVYHFQILLPMDQSL